jgi:chromosomal replication initiator protein
MTALWTSALSSLESRISPHNFEMWCRPIDCTEEGEDRLVLRAPNRFIKDWFEDHYLPVLLDELRAQTQRNFQIVVTVEDATPAPRPASADPTGSVGEPVSGGTPVTAAHPGTPNLSPRHTFDSFVVGPSNQLAHAAARAVAEVPGGKYNPLFLYGGVGLGKTHLINAIGNAILARDPSVRITYIPMERFVNEFVRDIRTYRMDDFRDRYRNQSDVLLVDDVQFIANKEASQEEFFHTFNSLYESHRQIVVSSDRFPHEMGGLEERLKTRFQWGLIADIQPPEVETRIAIVRQLADREAIKLPEPVVSFLAQTVRSNIRELEGSLIRLAAYASLQGRDITLDFARETLKNILAQQQATLSIDAVQKAVCAYYSVKLPDLKGPKRHRQIALPRQVAMFLARKLVHSSYPEIGHAFGGKDHTTVLSACRKIERLVGEDLAVRSAIEAIERSFDL